MMKHEFVALAGYEVSDEDYNNIIEPMYMSTNLSKADFIKTIDRKRFEVVPQKSEQRVRLEADINARIETFKNELEYSKLRLAEYKAFLKEEPDSDLWKGQVKYYRENIDFCKNSIAELKWVLKY